MLFGVEDHSSHHLQKDCAVLQESTHTHTHTHTDLLLCVYTFCLRGNGKVRIKESKTRGRRARNQAESRGLGALEDRGPGKTKQWKKGN